LVSVERTHSDTETLGSLPAQGWWRTHGGHTRAGYCLSPKASIANREGDKECDGKRYLPSGDAAHPLPGASGPAEHPPLWTLQQRAVGAGGSSALAASTHDSQIQPGPFSLLRWPLWGEGAGGHPESTPDTEAQQMKQLIRECWGTTG